MTQHFRTRAGWASLAVALALFGLLALPWMRRWGATDAEHTRTYAGDELLLTSGVAAPETRAITVNAPSTVTWEWVRRIGQGRGGFYSYDWLENLVGDDIHSRRDLFPAPPLAVGDTIKLTQETYPGARVGLSLLPVAAVTPGHAFVLPGWGTFVVESLGPARSRVIVHELPPVPANGLEAGFRNFVFEPAHFVMERQMLRGIRDRAEGVPAPIFAWIVATLGLFAGAAACVAVMVRRGRWRWLAVPVVLAALVFAGTGGFEAALAGFVALCVPGVVWAALRRDRVLAVVALLGAVLLLFLWAPDAYLVIGWLVGAVTGASLMPRWTRGTEAVSPLQYRHA